MWEKLPRGATGFGKRIPSSDRPHNNVVHCNIPAIAHGKNKEEDTMPGNPFPLISVLQQGLKVPRLCVVKRVFRRKKWTKFHLPC